MEKVIIGLGSNVGPKVQLIRAAIHLLQAYVGRCLNTSAFYETSPWGVEDQEWYVNAIVELETLLSPQEVLHESKLVEYILGRKKRKKWHAREIDIDILTFGNERINAEHLNIPHPYMHERLFVLEPLFEISPNFVHPTSHKHISELLSECKDRSVVKKMP